MSKKRNPDDSQTTEWTHLVSVESLPKAPLSVHMEAAPEDRKRLSQRMGLLGIKGLTADIDFERQQGSAVIHVTGSFSAVVEQACVVSGKKITSSISEDLEAWYADPVEAVSFAKAKQQREAKKTSAELPILEEKDDPEPIINGAINAGELVAQFLSLAIDPYPHAEEVVYENGDEKNAGNLADTAFSNPFAALKNWKSRKD